MSQDKVTNKMLEVQQFLGRVKHLRKFKKEDLVKMASKLVVKNCKLGEILCDQNELCKNLYIIKNGQISLNKVILKDSIDTSEYPAALKKHLAKIPDVVEVEVKLKFNPGDLLMVTEIVTGQPSKYRVRAKIPSQVYICTAHDIERYIGMDKFRKIPDADFFRVTDADMFRHYVETQLWDRYRESVFDEEMTVINKKEFYSKSKIRLNVDAGRNHKVDPTVSAYFKSKQEFFAPKHGVIEKLREKKLSLPSIAESRVSGHAEHVGRSPEESPAKFRCTEHRAGNFDQEIFYPFAVDEEDRESDDDVDRRAKQIVHNEYRNSLDDEYLCAIYKFQFKKIISAAYKDHKPVYHRELSDKNFSQARAAIVPNPGSGPSRSKLEMLRREVRLLESHAKTNHDWLAASPEISKLIKESQYLHKDRKKIKSSAIVSRFAVRSSSKN